MVRAFRLENFSAAGVPTRKEVGESWGARLSGIDLGPRQQSDVRVDCSKNTPQLKVGVSLVKEAPASRRVFHGSV